MAWTSGRASLAERPRDEHASADAYDAGKLAALDHRVDRLPAGAQRGRDFGGREQRRQLIWFPRRKQIALSSSEILAACLPWLKGLVARRRLAPTCAARSRCQGRSPPAGRRRAASLDTGEHRNDNCRRRRYAIATTCASAPGMSSRPRCGREAFLGLLQFFTVGPVDQLSHGLDGWRFAGRHGEVEIQQNRA